MNLPLPGTPVTVRVQRCIVKGTDWPPLRTLEEYKATVVRVGTTGMVYVVRASGAPGVVHPDQIQIHEPENRPPSPEGPSDDRRPFGQLPESQASVERHAPS